MPENNNSSNKESDREVFDFLSSEDSCDEWLPNILFCKKPVLKCSFPALVVKTLKITCEGFIFSNDAGLLPAALLKKELVYT